jgi:hypothetical protein
MIGVENVGAERLTSTNLIGLAGRASAAKSNASSVRFELWDCGRTNRPLLVRSTLAAAAAAEVVTSPALQFQSRGRATSGNGRLNGPEY